MTAHYTIRHRSLFEVIETLVSHPGTLSLRLAAAQARLHASAAVLPRTVKEEAVELADKIDRALAHPCGVGLEEAIGLGRQVVDLYDRVATPEGMGRGILFRRAWQRLHAALLVLCTEPGPIQERLSDAYLTAFVYWTAAEVPGTCEGEFMALRDELAQIVRFGTLAPERAAALAHKIVLLYAQLLATGPERRVPPPLALAVSASV